METRTIQTQIDDIESRIEAAIKAKQSSEKIIKWLNKKLDTFKYDQRLFCPLSDEPFSANSLLHTPYTLHTKPPSSPETVISLNSIEKFVEEKKLQYDPYTKHEIKGYTKNDKIIELVQQKEVELVLLEDLVIRAVKPANKKAFEMRIDSEEKEKQEKAAAALIQSSLFSQSQVQGNNKNSVILLYRARGGELAVKLPNEQLAESFVNYFREEDIKYPVRYTDQKSDPTVVFFEADQSEEKFTAVFPTSIMQLKFYCMFLVKNKIELTDVKVCGNKAGQHVIQFEDKVFYKDRGNVTVPVPQELLKFEAKQTQGMASKK
jgi:hypothetical protein